MQVYKFGSAVDLMARFGGASVERLVFEVTDPSGKTKSYQYGAGTEVLKTLGADGSPDTFKCVLLPEAAGDYTYAVKAQVSGREVFGSDTFTILPPEQEKRWKAERNCVHKVNADGSLGEQVKCHDSPEKARAHMEALYANTEYGKKSTDKEVVSTVEQAAPAAPAKPAPVAGATSPETFVVKTINGKRRWFGRPTLNTRDREGETVSKAALEEVVARSKAAGFYPPLQFFHIPYDVGITDDYRVVDGIVVATGEFNNDPVSKAIADYLEAHPGSVDGSGWAMSWRFYARPDAEGVYKKVDRIKEFTFLPYSQAANQDTRFVAERMKMLTKAQRDALDLVLADPALKEQAKQAIEAEVFGKSLDEAGAQRKDVSTPEAEQSTAQPEQEKKVEAPAAELPAAPAQEALKALQQKGGLKDRPLMISDITIIREMTMKDTLEIVKTVAGKKGFVTLDELNAAFKERDNYLADVVKRVGDLEVLDLGVQQQKVYNEVTAKVEDVQQALATLRQKQAELETMDAELRKQYDEPDIIKQWQSASHSASTLVEADSELAKAGPHEDKSGGVFERVGLRSNGKGH